MNREIKFRGKTEKDKIWVDGYYFFNGESSHGIIDNIGFPGNWVEVIPETIGQYTGLKDKNGKEVYEGDVLKDHGIVAWNDVEYRWSAIDLNWNDKREWHAIDYLTCPFEVIGNIFDNP